MRRWSSRAARSVAKLNALGLIALSACSSSDLPGVDTGPPKGTAVLQFSVAKDVRSNPALTSPLSGPVYGSIYLTEDVSLLGPRDGVSSLADVMVVGVDLIQ